MIYRLTLLNNMRCDDWTIAAGADSIMAKFACDHRDDFICFDNDADAENVRRALNSHGLEEDQDFCMEEVSE